MRNIFLSCPYIKHQNFDFSLVKNNFKSIVDFAICCIENNYYLTPWLQVQHIKAFNLPLDRPSFHPPLIYGYDCENGIFHFAAFMTNGKYEFSTMSFTELEKSYEGYPYIDIFKHHLDHTFHYEFNIDLIVKQLNDYLYSTNSFSNLREYPSLINYPNYPSILGLEFYNIIIYLLDKKIKKERIDVDYRIFHFLFDHKHIMKKAIEYMNNHGYIKNGNDLYQTLNNLEEDCIIIRNKILKYNINNNIDILIDVRKKLLKVIGNEKKIFTDILNNVRLNKHSKDNAIFISNRGIRFTTQANKLCKCPFSDYDNTMKAKTQNFAIIDFKEGILTYIMYNTSKILNII